MTGQPSDCTGVGWAKRRPNHAVTTGWNICLSIAGGRNPWSAALGVALSLAGEPAHQRLAAFVSGEEALDAELIERDVVRHAQARQRGEEREMRVVLGELHGEERR